MPIELTIHNYKCFREVSVNLLPLTVLSGCNGSGKSSLIQALLISRSVIENWPSRSEIPLNNLFSLELGRVGDVLNNAATDGTIEFTLAYDAEQIFMCIFDASESVHNDPFLTIAKVEAKDIKFLSSDEPFFFTYLNADRNGPRESQSIQSQSLQYMSVGSHGEYVADVLAANERTGIRKTLIHPSSLGSDQPNDKLLHNVQLWMRDLFPNLSISADYLSEANIAIVRFRRETLASEWARPVNSGFGLSYSLPIIVAGLLAPEGAILIVENPEAHLHPAAQSRIAQFLGWVAASGVNVIIETHSDHVINGIRLACVKNDSINRNDVAIYNLAGSTDDQMSVSRIAVTERGNLSDWPKDFFDQFERDLGEIIRSRSYV